CGIRRVAWRVRCILLSHHATSGRGGGVLLCLACLSGKTIDCASSRGWSIVPTGPITDGQSFLPALPKVAQKSFPTNLSILSISPPAFSNHSLCTSTAKVPRLKHLPASSFYFSQLCHVHFPLLLAQRTSRNYMNPIFALGAAFTFEPVLLIVYIPS
ncbi:unnamed protein product, partial [Ectocarpus sp. 8 AP-2014]